MNKSKIIIKRMFVILLSLFLVAIFSFLIYYFVITKNSNLDEQKLPLSYKDIKIFDNFGTDITQIYYSNYISKENIPKNIKLAFLTTEDREFYNHNGINYKRLLGALLNNIKNRDLSQGGSTITQQLVKNTHLTLDKNINRKLQEFKIAKQIENKFSKDEILEMYFNILYFGNGIYGINNASKVFFDKMPSELNLAEASMLAGVVKNPSRYSPIVNFNSSNERKNLILNLLYKNNAITQEELSNLSNFRIKIENKRINNDYLNSYITNAIYETKQLLNLNINDKLPKNISIYTNVELDKQRLLDDIISNKKFVSKNANHYPDNAMILIDNKTGNIAAFSSTYKQSQYLVKRQIGSLAKPFVSYLPALEENLINVATPIFDEPININGYSPSNYKGNFHGYTNMRESLAHSYNIPAVKILYELGVNKAKNFLNKINFSFTNQDNLAMALGGFTNGENIVNVAGAYTMLANGGKYIKPSFISKIIIDNKEIYNNRQNNKVASEENSYIITDCLESAVRYGTLKKLSYLPYDIAGKTGTVKGTIGNTDSYSSCYTTGHTIVSWQGNLSNKEDFNLPTNNTGGSYPTNQVDLVLNYLYKNNKPDSFIVPEYVVNKNVDLIELKYNHNVKLVDDDFPNHIKQQEIFNLNNLPKEKNTIKNYDNYTVDFINNFSNITINIKSNKLLNFEIYKKSIFNDELICDIKNEFNLIDTNFDAFNSMVDSNNNKIIKYNYTIKPYIILEENKKFYLNDYFLKIK